MPGEDAGFRVTGVRSWAGATTGKRFEGVRGVRLDNYAAAASQSMRVLPIRHGTCNRASTALLPCSGIQVGIPMHWSVGTHSTHQATVGEPINVRLSYQKTF